MYYYTRLRGAEEMKCKTVKNSLKRSGSKEVLINKVYIGFQNLNCRLILVVIAVVMIIWMKTLDT